MITIDDEGTTNIVGVGYYKIEAATTTIIPINRQHLTTGDIEIDGELTINGEMAVI